MPRKPKPPPDDPEQLKRSAREKAAASSAPDCRRIRRRRLKPSAVVGGGNANAINPPSGAASANRADSLVRPDLRLEPGRAKRPSLGRGIPRGYLEPARFAVVAYNPLCLLVSPPGFEPGTY
jgi:hypothetical protein